MEHKEHVINAVGKILRLQYSRKVSEAGVEYDSLVSYCVNNGIDFANAFEGSRLLLLSRACGVHDSAAYRGEQIPAPR